MPDTVKKTPVLLAVSPDRTRFWVNNEHQCVVRFSLVSGYEIYEPDGSMKAVRTGASTISQFIAFVTSVHAMYPEAIPEEIIKEFSTKCAEG